MNRAWLHVTGTILAGMVLAVALVTLGPAIERRAWPVVSVDAARVHVDGGSIVFDLVGRKLRSCRLDRWSIAWRLDSIYRATGLFDDKGNAVTIPAVLSRGDFFQFGPFYVPIPDIAPSYPDARLRIALYYACHGLYGIEHDVTVPVAGLLHEAGFTAAPMPSPPGM